MIKNETLTIRLESKVKKILRTIAKKENRSLTNMIETLIINYRAGKNDTKTNTTD